MTWYDEYRRRFPITERYAFFNHAAVSPLCPAAAEAVRDYATAAAKHSYLGSRFYERCEEVRAAAAAIVNAESPDCIAFVKNTSEGLAQVAEGFDWLGGANVVTTAVEFPANIYPWMNLERRGVELRMVGQVCEGGVCRVPTEDLLAAVDDHTALISVSAVQYGSGQSADLAAIGRFARERAIFFCVDAIQALGCRPIDVRANNIDFLSADGHKWLLAPEGAGVFYCRRELLSRLRPLAVGWANVVNSDRFEEYDFTLRSDGRRFECGSLNVAGIWGLGAAVDMFLDIGVGRVWKRVEALTDLLVEGLTAAGNAVASPRTESEKSGIVSWAPADGSADPAFVDRLRRHHRIIVAVRAGRYRASPHFYNSEDEIIRLIEAVRAQASE